MKTAVFAGPSLRGADCPGCTVLPPARFGSVFQAVEQGFERLLLIDGYFGNVPAVWHREILFALSKGCAVAGAASIGALRAAELHAFGMTGVGRVFRLYRAGVLTGDDEVCLSHGPRALNYVNLTVPSVNLRFTLRRLRRAGAIEAGQEAEAITRARNIHFSERTWGRIAEEFEAMDRPGGRKLLATLREAYVDMKRLDALALVTRAPFLSPPGPDARGHFRATVHWRRQFMDEMADVPPLDAEVEI